MHGAAFWLIMVSLLVDAPVGAREGKAISKPQVH